MNSFTPQQTQAWFDQRIGRITSSQLWRLMGVKSLGENKPLDKTAQKYIYERIGEIATGIAVEVSGKALEWGTDCEPEAKNEMELRNGTKMKDCEYTQDSEMYYYGGSPDGYIKINGIEYCVEIKCPYSIGGQIDNIRSCENLMALYPEVYYQLQSNMYLLGLQHGLFVTYDKRIKVGTGAYHQFEVPFNEFEFENVLIQLKKAWEFYKTESAKFGIDIEKYLKPIEK